MGHVILGRGIQSTYVGHVILGRGIQSTCEGHVILGWGIQSTCEGHVTWGRGTQSTMRIMYSAESVSMLKRKGMLKTCSHKQLALNLLLLNYQARNF